MSPERHGTTTAQADGPPVPLPGTEAGGQGPTRLSGFLVALPQFEGPFDLLLTLIARRRLDVTELALAEVIDDFLTLMRTSPDLGQASEFLVVAATLVALKAHRLLPQEPGEEEADMEYLEARDLLFARLLQYRAYKEAAGAIARAVRDGARSVPRRVVLAPDLAALLPPLVGTLSPQDLARHALRALTRPGPPEVQTVHLHERVAVGEQMNLIALRLRGAGRLAFSELIGDADHASVVVARFLALLVLYRQGSVDLEQAEAMGEIAVTWCGPESDLTGLVAPEVEEEFT